MNIADNTFKSYLRNVYFITGNACGGKTTMSRLIAQKYGFYLYNQDDHYDQHRSVADEANQPAMCYQRNDFEEFCNRPSDVYANWMHDTLEEEAEMVLMDLIRLSENNIVIADVLFSADFIDTIVEKDHVIFLTTDCKLMRKDYFNRLEKREFYNCVLSLSNPERTFENIFNSLELTMEREKKSILKSGFEFIERNENSNIEETLSKIEKVFGLSPTKYNFPITTEHLCIRPFKKEDLREFSILLDIPELPGWKMQKNNVEAFFDWHISKYDKMDIQADVVCFGIFDKMTGNILGNVGIGKHDDLDETELFYALTVDARGKGYATEASKAVTKWTFAHFSIPYLIGTTTNENIASQRVLEKCGYQLINEQTLKVQILNQTERFKYYRCYAE